MHRAPPGSHPDQLLWPRRQSLDPDEDEVTSCTLHRSTHNTTHAQYVCHMNLFHLMADDIFSVNMTDQSGNHSQECRSFIIAESSKYPDPRAKEPLGGGWAPRSLG